MIGPLIAPRIKQPDNFRRNRIDAGEARAFAEIAAVTGKGQIGRIIASTVLARHYVLDMMRKRATFLRKETVFATISHSASDECPCRWLHRYGASASCLRAFSFRIARKSSALTNASYSARSSSGNRPSLARSAKASTLSYAAADTPNARMRRADSASRQRLSGSRNSSSRWHHPSAYAITISGAGRVCRLTA